MKTMLSKYPGTCRVCAQSIAKGETIVWSRAGGAQHPKCAGVHIPESPQSVRAPCWGCKSPDGRFRQHGAAAPIYCDECEAKNQQAKAAQPSRYRSNYTRFSSGAEVFTNKRGRCIDAPCCGCCS